MPDRPRLRQEGQQDDWLLKGAIRSLNMRRLLDLLHSLRRRVRSLKRSAASARPDGLTAVEYEAVSLIAYEGQNAYWRAREQARYCRERGSEQGYRFWSEVAGEIRLRTKGRTWEKG